MRRREFYLRESIGHVQCSKTMDRLKRGINKYHISKSQPFQKKMYMDVMDKIFV